MNLFSPGGGNAYGKCVSGCEACANSSGGTCFTFTECEGEPNCVCFNTTEGGGFCGAGAFCNALPTCSTSADCPTGWFCSATTCCALFGFPPICNPPCSTNPGIASSPAQGPTNTGF
jgi:hypothetical protein